MSNLIDDNLYMLVINHLEDIGASIVISILPIDIHLKVVYSTM
jgi:hypothetical protein